jgi:hypothetical protein
VLRQKVCFEQIIGKESTIKKTILGLISKEEGFCSLETKHNRMTMPRPELFVSKRRLQKQRPQPLKTVLGSIPGEDVFCNEVTEYDNGTKNKILFQ